MDKGKMKETTDEHKCIRKVAIKAMKREHIFEAQIDNNNDGTSRAFGLSNDGNGKNNNIRMQVKWHNNKLQDVDRQVFCG